jgi:hypothetical protein
MDFVPLICSIQIGADVTVATVASRAPHAAAAPLLPQQQPQCDCCALYKLEPCPDHFGVGGGHRASHAFVASTRRQSRDGGARRLRGVRAVQRLRSLQTGRWRGTQKARHGLPVFADTARGAGNMILRSLVQWTWFLAQLVFLPYLKCSKKYGDTCVALLFE